MLVKVHFFKPSGKWYTTELVEIPAGTAAWHGRNPIEAHLRGRLDGMTAVIVEGAPWGFPIAYPDLYDRAREVPGSIGEAIAAVIVDLQEGRSNG